MLKLLVFILVSYGVSNIVTQAHGPFNCFTQLREYANKHFYSNLGEMFSCQICFPFWVGIFLSFFVYSPALDCFVQPHGEMNLTFLESIMLIMCDGALASGSVWILHNIEEYFEYSVNKEEDYE